MTGTRAKGTTTMVTADRPRIRKSRLTPWDDYACEDRSDDVRGRGFASPCAFGKHETQNPHLSMAVLVPWDAGRADAGRPVGMNCQAVRDWAPRYNAEGPEGPWDRARISRARSLDENRLSVVQGWVEAGSQIRRTTVSFDGVFATFAARSRRRSEWRMRTRAFVSCFGRSGFAAFRKLLACPPRPLGRQAAPRVRCDRSATELVDNRASCNRLKSPTRCATLRPNRGTPLPGYQPMTQTLCRGQNPDAHER